MPRTRRLNPAALLDERLAKLPPAARLILAYLPCLADREGRLEDRPERIRAEIFPYEPHADTPTLLQQLAAGGWITRYHTPDHAVILLPTFTAEQRPHDREPQSRLPAPQGEPKAHPGRTQGEPKANPRPTSGSLDLDLDPNPLPPAAALPAELSSPPPPPPPAPTPAAWPATAAELRSHFPTDDAFTAQLAAAARQADPTVTDGELAGAVAATWRKGQHSAGLWLHTIPHYLTLQLTARIPPARATDATGADPRDNRAYQTIADDDREHPDIRRAARHALRA